LTDSATTSVPSVPNQGQSTSPITTKSVPPIPSSIKENTVESLEKKCSDLQNVLTKANEAAHAAHQNLMNAQRELLAAKAN